MNYKKYEINGYNLHVIQSSKFKTVEVKIILKHKINKEQFTIRRLLVETLLQSSKKYPTRRLLEEKCEDLYGISINGVNSKSGNYDLIILNETFLNEKYTESNMMKESLEFLFQILYNPDIKENQFSKYGFDLAKRILTDDINTFSDYPSSYSSSRLLEEMAPKSPISYRKCGYIKDLKKITPSSLYAYYQDVLKEDAMDIFIIGDIDLEKTKQVVEEKFPKCYSKKDDTSHFLKLKELKTKPSIIREKQKIKQSHLLIGFNFEELSDYELHYVLNVYSYILGGSGDSLLFKKVREENSLCYSISSSYNIINNILVVSADISAKNYDKVVKLILETIEIMKAGKFDQKEIEKAKTIYQSSCIEIMDSMNSIINIYSSHEYLNSDLLEKRKEKIELVTKEMVVALANKIHIHTIYMLEGENNEKKVS